MEARTELDTLEQILSSPLFVPNMPRWAPFFKAIPRLLGSGTTVEALQQELVVLLFPGLEKGFRPLGALRASGTP